MWCITWISQMTNIKGTRKTTSKRADTVRASISFPSGIYQSLERLAKENKVSLAWIVRQAAEEYVAHRLVPSRRGQTA